MRGAFVALVALLPLCMLAQPLPPGVRGPQAAATRSVAAYLTLERALADAVQAGDRDAAQRMLADGFVARTGGNPASLTADDWLARAMHGRPAGVVRELAVDEFDDIAVVSFMQDERRTTSGRTVATSRYVVDVWRASTQKLLARYVAPPSRVAPPPVRPTGRE
jgi:hypothetical protein